MVCENHKSVNNSFFFFAVMVITLFFACKTIPTVPQEFLQEERFLPLEDGASVYLVADVQRARNILDLLPIEELNDSQVKQMLDRTGYAAAALFPQGSGRRFQLTGWGNYPSFRAGFAFTFNSGWRKQRSESGGSYWHSQANRLSLALTSDQVFAAASLNNTPFDPLKSTNQIGVQIPEGFNDFRAGSPMSFWLVNARETVSSIFTGAGIPIQFPVQQLFINLYPVSGGYEALLLFQMESAVQSRGMVTILNLASSFMGDDSGMIIASLLFANRPVQIDKSLEVKTAVMNEAEVLQLFNMFLKI